MEVKSFFTKSNCKKLATKRNFVLVLIVLAVVIGGFVFCRNSGYGTFVKAFESENYDKAIKVMSRKINSEATNDRIIEFLNNEAENCYNQFVNETTTYEAAKKHMEVLQMYIDVAEYAGKIENLNNSKETFKKAESLKNSDPLAAIEQYNRVYTIDKNYSKAQEQIKKLTSEVVKENLPKLEQYEQNGDFESGYKLSGSIANVIDNDKINEYYKQFKKQYEDNEKLKNCDLTTSEGIKTYLTIKYGLLKNTAIGDIEFEFEVSENSGSNLVSYDFQIMADDMFTTGKLDKLRTSNKYSMAERRTADAQLKKHMETLAKDIISKLPDKKFSGCYGKMHQISEFDFRTIYRCYSWTNYSDSYSGYYNTAPGAFRWNTYIKGFVEN